MKLPLTTKWVAILATSMALLPGTRAPADSGPTPEEVVFFEKSIRPVLVTHCYKCHSAEAMELGGGLLLDTKKGWQTGGHSGKPAVVPGKPDSSPLIRAVRHEKDMRAMPPYQPRLQDAVISDLTAWVKMGAPDPRQEKVAVAPAQDAWEAVYQKRLKWWSLRPLGKTRPGPVKQPQWVRNDVDHFILAALEAKGLQPAPEADRRVLARRASLALTGLPPREEIVERFLADASPCADDNLVQSLLDNPHFGEHWARHWMDVVHYSDTHGYEWDVPAKNAWMYRDYLVRALNADLPFNRLLLEQIAGDLLEPRVDTRTGLNESLLGPMALRLGERRHGDNAASEGVSQEAVANIIDTVGKGFLGTTVACAQCHDHKLDAVAQRDYYALAGLFMSARWIVRCADASDPNEAVINELRQLKQQIRAEIAKVWLGSRDSLVAKIRAIAGDEKAATAFPETLAAFWRRSLSSPLTSEEFSRERERRIVENRANLKLLADFSREDGDAGWQWDGFGMRHGLVRDGEIVVADEGDAVIAQVLLAGRWSHVWSSRLAGALRSPLLDPHAATRFSVGLAGGKHAAHSFIVDNTLHSERMQFVNQPLAGWLTLTAGNFVTLEGGVDTSRRRVYLELVTKSLNNYFPPRFDYGNAKESELADERSWFGVTRIYQHPPDKPPLDELTRFVPLLACEGDWATRLANLVHAAIERWSRNENNSEDVRLLDDALQSKLLPNDLNATPQLTRLVSGYRSVEKKLQPDRTIGSMADWNEGRNEQLSIRGSYTDLGEEVNRGNIRFLGSITEPASSSSSGRLEFARSIVSEQNPLTARVFVNRVWLHLFGEGLVRTPDDFGHLGESPLHSELLDYLALRFMTEGWSLKKLVKLLVTSATWRQGNRATQATLEVDAENRLWHHMPLRRLEAEAIRDSILAASERLDPTLYGPPVDPYRVATDPTKRLLIGPLDGNGRRSLYTKMTLMEPPRFLALFNQPIPRLTTGRRDVTNVPDQALALLNDPFVIAMAKYWSERKLLDGAKTPEGRVRQMFTSALARTPDARETARFIKLVSRSAELRGMASGDIMHCQPVWQDVAHAIFNLKEFIYVP